MASPISNNTETDVNLVRRSNSCTRKYEGVDFRWNIYLDNDDYYNTECGKGCLDNFRGKCATITNWDCKLDSAKRAHYEFITPVGCSSYAITQALKKCTKGEQTINCV